MQGELYLSIIVTGENERAAYERAHELSEGFELGAGHVQVGPFTEEMLVEAVRRLYQKAKNIGLVDETKGRLFAGWINQMD